MPSWVTMGRIRDRARGRGRARRRDTGGTSDILPESVLSLVTFPSVVLLLVLFRSFHKEVSGGNGMEICNEPGGSPFLVGCAFLILPSGIHCMVASSVMSPASCCCCCCCCCC